MSFNRGTIFGILTVLALFATLTASAQSGNAGIVRGTVADPSGALVSNATVHLTNPTSGLDHTTTTDATGQFEFDNVPFNPYRIVVTANGFATTSQTLEIRSSVGVSLKLTLTVSGGSQTVSVEAAGDLIENDPNFHADIDRGLFDKLPLESQSSSLSSLVTLASPGIAADSNGLFHGLGDHAENSFSVDGQPVTDQVSKVFSNQVPSDSIQSMEVIDGAPPAEYGGKTSVVVVVTTRSGLGAKTPHGEIIASYGTFGSSTVGANATFGSEKWGNFISLGGLNTSRFLDPPEFKVFHDKGNEENFFDRSDYRLSANDMLQLNLGFTRSWFETPNTYDQQLQTCTVLSTDCDAAGTTLVNPVTGSDLTPTDQRSQIRTFNVSPIWTHTLGPTAVVSISPYVRHDQYNYYPSPNSFSDLGPLQDETVSQLRFLTNAGIRGSVTYAKGIHNVKIGAQYEHTFLTENDGFAIVNPGLLPACPSSFTAQCATLAPYDLTTGGSLYVYHGHTDIKELALYAQDEMTIGPWAINFGVRGDFYNGLQAVSKQAEPRAGISYNIKKTNTVLRVSYARTLESPFNENLVLSSTGCNNAVVDAIMTVAQGFACQDTPIQPGFRNEFHGGIQQAFGKYFVLSGEYITKYTHNGYDFNVFGTSPITLPIEWHNSKIPGFALRGSVPDFHGLSAFVVMSHVSARFFPPAVAGIAPPAPPAVFRIDHDEKFNETTHVQYQPFKRLPWAGFNWRYDSGLVAGFVPCLAATATCSFSTSVADGGLANIPQGYVAMVNNLNGLPLTADQELEAGFTCNGVAATATHALPSTCLATQLNSNLVKIPAPGTEQDDKNPQRIQPRNLFDASVGDDDLFKGDKYKWSLRLSGVNVGNKFALYNYLSTFSGTHYVTPRALTAEVGFHF
jgi:carboxypeptidase family protein